MSKRKKQKVNKKQSALILAAVAIVLVAVTALGTCLIYDTLNQPKNPNNILYTNKSDGANGIMSTTIYSNGLVVRADGVKAVANEEFLAKLKAEVKQITEYKCPEIANLESAPAGIFIYNEDTDRWLTIRENYFHLGEDGRGGYTEGCNAVDNPAVNRLLWLAEVVIANEHPELDMDYLDSQTTNQ
jgi:hypothetical protein